MPDHTFAAILATARTASGLSAAEFDYSLTRGPDGAAIGAIGNAVYDAANSHLPAVRTGDSEDILRQRDANSRALSDALRPEILTLVTAAAAKSYTGWSQASAGPIRYAH